MSERLSISRRSADFDTYFLCSTPRTGSTLLCNLLASTGVAGAPHSFFRAQDIERRAVRWGLGRHFTYSNYVRAVRERTASTNGVVGVRVMWGTLDEMLDALTAADSDTGPLALLEAAFGRLRFVHLAREDTVAQAISLYRAEATDYWHSTQGTRPGANVEYSYREIADRVASLNDDDAGWKRWFNDTGITPLSVTYEQLDAAPQDTAGRVLRYLGLASTEPDMKAPNQRLADATTLQWRQRFIQESGDALGQ